MQQNNSYTSSWRSPSNIALIKYWGKHGLQLPENPSLSLTLSACHTNMHIEVETGAPGQSIHVMYDGIEKPSFVPKIRSYFLRIREMMPWIDRARIIINTVNTFPHGAGIASSASAMSALALCLLDIDENINGRKGNNTQEWWQKASELARLGSGSACRSVYPVAALWGKTAGVKDSHDRYALAYGDHLDPFYQTYHDTILVVSMNEKTVSSSAGHELMSGHPYASVRYKNAIDHLSSLMTAMKNSDQVEEFIRICEAEALELHALMMMSNPSYILMEPATLSIIHQIREWRQATGLPVCFTLDAGPTVHLLYPENIEALVREWIQSDLQQYCFEGKHIHDQVGTGPVRLSS